MKFFFPISSRFTRLNVIRTITIEKVKYTEIGRSAQFSSDFFSDKNKTQDALSNLKLCTHFSQYLFACIIQKYFPLRS